MANILDVAEYILERKGPMSAMKLQKLCYYAKAWYLVWAEKEIFPERIEAWANGPVIPELFKAHQGMFLVSPGKLCRKPTALTADQEDALDKVLSFYGDQDPQWLSDLTHMEDPWRNARNGLADGAWSDREITNEAMAEYYESL